MDPYELDDEYRDHVNRTDHMNPSAEEEQAAICNPLGSYTQPCAWCGEPFEPHDSWHLRREHWYHQGCAEAFEEAFEDAQAHRPRSALAARIVAEGHNSPTLKALIERQRCE